MGTLIEKCDQRKVLIAAAFHAQYLKQFKTTPSVAVFEAPAAENWVVIVNAAEAWVAASDGEDFVFWGPLGKRFISFAIPEGWPT